MSCAQLGRARRIIPAGHAQRSLLRVAAASAHAWVHGRRRHHARAWHRRQHHLFRVDRRRNLAAHARNQLRRHLRPLRGAAAVAARARSTAVPRTHTACAGVARSGLATVASRVGYPGRDACRFASGDRTDTLRGRSADDASTGTARRGGGWPPRGPWCRS